MRCFKMRIETAGLRSLEGSLAICYTLPCSVLTLPSCPQFLVKALWVAFLCLAPFFAPSVSLAPTEIQAV